MPSFEISNFLRVLFLVFPHFFSPQPANLNRVPTFQKLTRGRRFTAYYLETTCAENALPCTQYEQLISSAPQRNQTTGTADFPESPPSSRPSIVLFNLPTLNLPQGLLCHFDGSLRKRIRLLFWVSSPDKQRQFFATQRLSRCG